jgi:hypothetical protein
LLFGTTGIDIYSDINITEIDDCTVRDEWFIKRSLELRAKMIILRCLKYKKSRSSRGYLCLL